jgi:LDH2 family malate/lactate/ureidoglycolate dehydrogenase
MGERITLGAARVEAYLAALFRAAGVEAGAAAATARGLVQADLDGAGSHGVLQAPNYLRRIMAGTIARGGAITRVHESGAVAVYDAGLILGHVAAAQAVDAACAIAARLGVAVVAVRGGTHFGVAGHHARRAAETGRIGIASCNTRPMMPAPGGAAPVVGNNPLAIAVPVAGRAPVVFDMAMSAAAMGRVRQAAMQGESIPPGWAVDAAGHDTTDARAALAGMLLPAGGAKGFGLALMVDLLCALAGGVNGGEARPMFADPAAPAETSWLFVVIDAAHFGLETPYPERVAALSAAVLGAPVRTGGGPARLPGDRGRAAAAHAAGMLALDPRVLAELDAISAALGGPDLER